MVRLPHKPPLGQHFLADPLALERIASALDIEAGDVVLEIGPGEGALTEHLLGKGARVTALEIDPRLAARLKERFEGNSDLEIVASDVLNVDFGSMIAERSNRPVPVAGNLPYYITSPILRKVFSASEQVLAAVFLMQKEVALRVVADSQSQDYSFLSVLCQLYADAEFLFTVPSGSFRPAPKVTSALVRLTMRHQAVPDRLLVFLKAAFRQPRKTLSNNLVTLYPRSVLASLPEGRRRAQELSLDELKDLWGRLDTAVG